MTILFGVFLLTLLVITALAIVRTSHLFSAVILTSIFSLLMAANFFLLDAADVALTEAAIGVAPSRAHKRYLSVVIQLGVPLQKFSCFRVVVRGRDVGRAVIEHQTRQSDTAAYFQDAFSGNFKVGHEMGEYFSRRPDHAKQGPRSRRNAERFRDTIGIAELLVVTQCPDVDIQVVELDEYEVGLVYKNGDDIRRPSGRCGAVAPARAGLAPWQYHSTQIEVA